MSKVKKVLLGVVIAVMVIFTVGIIIMMVYYAMKEEPRFSLHHPSGIDGKVIEIIDKNNILIEITGDHDGFDIGDKVVINYKRTLLHVNNDKADKIPVVLYLGDIVSVQFWGDDVKQGDEYEVITVANITIYDFADNGESFRGIFKEHYNYIVGKVVEVKGDNSVVVEITTERAEYNLGKCVVIEYEQALHWLYASEEDETKDKKINIGNVISIEFWCDDVEHNDEMDTIKVKDIYIDNWHDLSYEVEYKK